MPIWGFVWRLPDGVGVLFVSWCSVSCWIAGFGLGGIGGTGGNGRTTLGAGFLECICYWFFRRWWGRLGVFGHWGLHSCVVLVYTRCMDTMSVFVVDPIGASLECVDGLLAFGGSIGASLE